MFARHNAGEVLWNQRYGNYLESGRWTLCRAEPSRSAKMHAEGTVTHAVTLAGTFEDR